MAASQLRVPGEGEASSPGSPAAASSAILDFRRDASDVRTGRSLEGLDLRAAIAGKQFGWDACLGVLVNHSPGSPHCFIAGAKAGDAGGLCHVTREQHAFVQYLNSFLTHLFPLQTWSSFCASRNEFAHIHQDLNAEGSFNHTVSLGPFHGGQLWICRASVDEDLVPPPDSQANQSLRGFLVNTRRSAFSFDGREAHCSQPWSGDRRVITAYATSTWQNSSPEDDNPEQTRALLQKQLDEGWLEQVPLEEARQRWSHVGKPRLIVDSSVCGLNSPVPSPRNTACPP